MKINQNRKVKFYKDMKIRTHKRERNKDEFIEINRKRI